MHTVAAIQIDTRLEEVAYNQDHAREFAEKAANKSAGIIAVHVRA